MASNKDSLKDLPEVFECQSYDHLTDELTRHISSLSEQAIRERGRFTIALAGGTTPKGLYRRMSELPYQNQFKWPGIHFFWGDERWVAPDHLRSNYRMVAESLLGRADIPVENIHAIRIKGSDSQTSAALYEKELIAHFGLKQGEFPSFDLILLGLGQDGHVASLFPGSPALKEQERFVVPVRDEEMEEERITLTLPVINCARRVIFMVSGSEKAKALYTILESGETRYAIPARMVRPKNGTLAWFVDKQAAQLLQKVKKITLHDERFESREEL